MVMAAAGIAVIVFNGAVRDVEAVATGALIPLLFQGRTWVEYPDHTVFWTVHDRVVGLRVTGECTSALLIGPLLVVAAVLSVGDRFPRTTVLKAAFVVSAGFFSTNLVRLTLIGWATQNWGPSGLNWSHIVVGSVLTMVGVVVALVLFVRLLVRSRRRVG